MVVSAFDGPPFDCECPICRWMMEQEVQQQEIAPGIYASALSDAQFEEYRSRFGDGVFEPPDED